MTSQQQSLNFPKDQPRPRSKHEFRPFDPPLKIRKNHAMSTDDTTKPFLPAEKPNISPLGEVPVNPNKGTTILPDSVPDLPKGGPITPPAPKGTTTVPLPPSPGNPPSKALVLSLGSVAAVLLGISGYQYYQGSELRQSLAETQGRTEAADVSNKDLASKLAQVTDGRKADAKGHAASLADKEQEVAKASEKAKGLSDEIERETAKGKELESKLAAALGEASEMPRLKEDLEKQQQENKALAKRETEARAELEKLKLTAKTLPQPGPEPFDATQPNPPPVKNLPISPEPKMPVGLAWVRLVRYENGENKGRCSFQAPDGFVSEYYPSRAAAVAAAELRAGVKQPPLLNVSATSTESGAVVKRRVGTEQSHVIHRSSK